MYRCLYRLGKMAMLGIAEIIVLIFFAGIILLIYILIYYLVRKAQNLRIYVPSQQQPQVKYCPSCGKQIPIDSKLCPYCGMKLPDNL